MNFSQEEISTKTKLFISYISNIIPKFKIVNKKNNFFMKFVSIEAITLYPKIYINKNINDEDDAKNYFSLLAHEYTHLFDRLKWGWLKFNFMYFMPQIFVVFVLLAFVNLWFLLFLIFLLPLPSLRAIIEFKGYTMSLACKWWIYKEEYDYDIYINYLVSNFTNSIYYFMFPFRSYLISKFNKELEKIKRNEFSFQQLKEVHDILTK